MSTATMTEWLKQYMAGTIANTPKNQELAKQYRRALARAYDFK